MDTEMQIALLKARAATEEATAALMRAMADVLDNPTAKNVKDVQEVLREEAEEHEKEARQVRNNAANLKFNRGMGGK